MRWCDRDWCVLRRRWRRASNAGDSDDDDDDDDMNVVYFNTFCVLSPVGRRAHNLKPTAPSANASVFAFAIFSSSSSTFAEFYCCR